MKAAIYINRKSNNKDPLENLELCKSIIEENGFLIYHVYYDEEINNLVEDSKKGLFAYIVCNEEVEKLSDLYSKGINLIIC